MRPDSTTTRMSMERHHLSEMTRGWFIGNFSPSLLRTETLEAAVREFPAGASEEWHYHRIATEFTVVISGTVRMNNVTYGKGDIVVMRPGEGTDFEALTDAVTAVIKIPGAPNDKYLRGQ